MADTSTAKSSRRPPRGIPRHFGFLFAALITLNLLLRYPFSTTLYGTDTFFTTGIALSIGQWGHAAWIHLPLDYFGLPDGQPEAVPFLLSTTAQLAGTNIIAANYLLTSMLTILSVLGAACLALSIRKDLTFAFVTAVAFSLAPRLVEFTTNQASTRDLFVVLSPLAVLFLIRAIEDRQHRWTWAAILEPIVLVLIASHHIGVLFLFVMAIAILCIPFVKIVPRNRITRVGLLPMYLALFGILLVVPILRPSWLPIQIPNLYTTGRFFVGTSLATTLANLAIDFASSSGPLFLLAPVGIAWVLRAETLRTRYLLAPMALLIFAPTLVAGYYSYFVLLAPISLLSALGVNAVRCGFGAPVRRQVATLGIAVVLCSASAVYVLDAQAWQSRVLAPQDVNAGLFLKAEPGGMFAVSDILQSPYRIWTISGRPPLAYTDIPARAYGIVPPSQEFDARGVYVQIVISGRLGDPATQHLLLQYDLTEFVENRAGSVPSYLLPSLRDSAYVVYSDPAYNIWRL